MSLPLEVSRCGESHHRWVTEQTLRNNVTFSFDEKEIFTPLAALRNKYQMRLTRYDLDSIKRGMRDPSLIKREISRRSLNPVRFLKSVQFKREYGDGIDVMQNDWDNLIILDALRYDHFENYNQLDGTLSKIVSKGAHSWEFMQGNFVGRKHHDTVYVTANPHVSKLSDDVFYTTETLFDKWQDDPGTVMPEDVVESAITAHQTYPHKRLIVHFMQPHGPHLGSTAEGYRERLDIKSWNPPENKNQHGMRWDQACDAGEISVEEIRKAYVETLEYVLPHVENLTEKLDGKTVITSDHGQMLGEQLLPGTSRIFGHPHDVYTPELCIVPWFEMETKNRRKIRSEESIGHESVDEDTINKRLQALGYKTE